MSDPSDESARTTYGDSNELIRGLQRHDPRALEALYDSNARRAFGLACRVLGDTSAAEDAVQEAFLAIWRNAHRLDPARGNVSSLLMTIVHHKAIDSQRARRGHGDPLPLDFATLADERSADVLDAVDASAGRELVLKALGSLSPDQRRAIELAYFDGLTHVEIAEKLGIPLGTVKSRLRLALDKLRAALSPEATRLGEGTEST